MSPYIVLLIITLLITLIVGAIMVWRQEEIIKLLKERLIEHIEITKQLYQARGEQAGAAQAKQEAKIEKDQELLIHAKITKTEIVNPPENPVIVKPVDKSK